jgi:hypothetical protein
MEISVQRLKRDYLEEPDVERRRSNSKVVLKEVGCERVEVFHLSLDKNQWRAHVNMLMSRRTHKDFLTFSF